MKRNYSVLALASLVALASACSDGDRPVTPTPGNDAGTDSAAGAPLTRSCQRTGTEAPAGACRDGTGRPGTGAMGHDPRTGA